MRSQALIHEAATDTLFCEIEARAKEPGEIDHVKRGMVRLMNALKRIERKAAVAKKERGDAR